MPRNHVGCGYRSMPYLRVSLWNDANNMLPPDGRFRHIVQPVGINTRAESDAAQLIGPVAPRLCLEQTWARSVRVTVMGVRAWALALIALAVMPAPAGDLHGSFCTERIDGKGPGAVVSITLEPNIRQARGVT